MVPFAKFVLNRLLFSNEKEVKLGLEINLEGKLGIRVQTYSKRCLNPLNSKGPY